ncbi:MAG TPA: hypothetical protein DCQ31_01455, partial [Bacteroidales bacterium]|nr:hypothetical protein [Bacteroidales bacterium]
MLILDDITERKKSELALKESERKLQESNEELKIFVAGVEQSGSSIIFTDLEGRIEYVNKKFNEITGYTLEEVQGTNARILKGGVKSAEYYTEMWDTIQSGKTWKGEFSNVNKKGELYYGEAIISPIKND